jgi:hypothetical protein
MSNVHAASNNQLKRGLGVERSRASWRAQCAPVRAHRVAPKALEGASLNEGTLHAVSWSILRLA